MFGLVYLKNNVETYEWFNTREELLDTLELYLSTGMKMQDFEVLVSYSPYEFICHFQR